MVLYVRVKRKKATYFVQVSPSETILELKQKLQEYCSIRPEEQQILKKRNDGWKPLSDGLLVQETGIQNDEVLALSFRRQDGSFEAVDITPYEVEMASS